MRTRPRSQKKNMSCEKNSIIDDYFNLSKESFVGLDVIIKFCAIVHSPSIKDEELYNNVNHKLAVFLAKIAKDAGVRHFIQFSTAIAPKN